MLQRFSSKWGLVLLAACFIATAGCNKPGSNSNSGSTSGSAAGKRIGLAFVTNNASDFWTYAHAGCDKAVAELGNVDLEFKVPNDGSAATQKRIVQDLLAKGVNGIAISPKDPANQTELLNEAAKQALLICHDSDAPTSDRACYIGTDNTAAGRQAGGLIKEAIPKGGKIMLFVGTLDAQNAKDRYTGIQEALKGSNVEILEVRTDETDRVRAKSNVKDAILKYPDIACLVGLWSYNGPAIYNAVKDADKVGKIQIVTFDEEEETLMGVNEGAIFATVVQQPYEFGYQAIKLMARVIGGDKSAIPANKVIVVPTLAIKKADVEAFTARLKKLKEK